MQISGLLDVYKKRLRAPQKTVIVAFCDAVVRVMGVTLETRLVRYTPTSQTIVLSTSGMMKQEIKMREAEILAAIAKDIGQKNTPQRIV